MADERLDLLAVDAFTWTPHLATTVEICLRHAEMGQRVGFVFLDVDNIDEYPRSFVPGAPLSRWNGPLVRRSRRAAVAEVEKVLRDNGVIVIRSPRPAPLKPRPSCASLGIDSIDSLRAFRYRDAALGLGVLSSAIRQYADPRPDFAECRALVDHLLNSACATFDLASELIERFHPATVLVYNGRLACSKAISEAARLAGAELLYHEIGATHERFYLANRPVQSVENARAMLKENWENAGADRESIAHQFFTRGRGGAPLIFTEFYREQVPGLSVPRTDRRRIVYFVSSDDEHAAVEDGLDHPLFASQLAAATWLADWVRDRPEVELLIRVHPRMRNSSPREQARWDRLGGGNVTTIRADDAVDSYALAASADVVVCYRSTMGAEATYLGKVAIVLGDAVYLGLDCVYEPRTVSELEGMLKDHDLQPKERDNCLPLGYERMTRGDLYRFYKPESVAGGTFFGEVVGRNRTYLADRIGMKALSTTGRILRPGVSRRERSRR